MKCYHSLPNVMYILEETDVVAGHYRLKWLKERFDLIGLEVEV